MTNRVITVTVGLSLALVSVHLLGLFIPTATTWGTHFLAFLPAWYTYAYLLAAITLLICIPRGRFDKRMEYAARFAERSPTRFLFILLGVFIVIALLFRVRAPLLGDGFFLVRNFSESFRGIAPLYPRNEPLATHYFAATTKLFGASTYGSFLNAFLAAEMLLGIGFVINVFYIVRLLFQDERQRLLALLLTLVIPSTQVFFGYVETYAVVLFTVSLYVNAALHYLHGKSKFILVVCAFLLQVLAHYLTILLFPSLVYLAVREWKMHERNQVIGGVLVGAGVMALALIVSDFDMEKFSSRVPHSHYLGLTAATNATDQYAEAYTLVSLEHLLDKGNLLIMTCPAGFALLVLGLRSPTRNSHLKKFFAAAIAPLILGLAVVRFDLGGPRDWDVFTFFYVLLAISGCAFFFDTCEKSKMRTVMMLAGFTLLHSLLFFSVNANTASSEQRFNTFFDSRLLSPAGHYAASLHLSQYYHQVGEKSKPVALWQNYARQFPTDSRGYLNVINNLSKMGRDVTREICQTFDQWITSLPDDTTARDAYVKYCFEAGSAAFSQNRLAEAETHFKKVIELQPSSAHAFNNLGSVYAERNEMSRAQEAFRRALELDSSYADAYYNLGMAHIDMGQIREGRFYLGRSHALGNAHAEQMLKSSYSDQ